MTYDTYCECVNENIVGGHPVCHIRGECMCCRCEYFKETGEWKEYLKDYDEDEIDYMAKPSWNEPRGRCYEGIPDDLSIPKTHLNEWDYKQQWRSEWKEWNEWLFNKYHVRFKL